MSGRLRVEVPDIGEFSDVEVIEVLVKPGDSVKPEQSLITLESDKASMEIPSPAAGLVATVLVNLGDKVSQGSPILELELAATASAAPGLPAAAAVTPAGIAPSDADLECELLVLGGGPGGYSAAFRAADLGRRVILVERFATLGGVCLNVGCIPSKALLHVAAVIDEAAHFEAMGVAFAAPAIDLEKLRHYKDQVVGRLTGGLGTMARMRKITVLRGAGEFVDAHCLEVEQTEGPGRSPTGVKRRVRFEQAIVAAGSEAVKLPFLPQDPRIFDSTGALELRAVPPRLLVVGGGIIGLEMATVYAALGSRVEVVEMTAGLMPGTDRDLVRVWQKFNSQRFARVMLNTRLAGVDAGSDALRARFEGENAPGQAQEFDAILVAVGRVPNGRRIGAERAGLKIDERGFVPTDSQRRSNLAHVFAIGDIAGGPMLAHKAVHEGHVAAEAASGMKSHFDAQVIPSVAYTDPEIAWVGLTEDEARQKGIEVKKGMFPWTASGRAIANGRDEGFTKLLFDRQSHRILGGAIVGTHAGDLIGEIALAIEMGADAVDIGRTIHPHPTLGESIGMAAEVAEAVCTDLPPARR